MTHSKNPVSMGVLANPLLLCSPGCNFLASELLQLSAIIHIGRFRCEYVLSRLKRTLFALSFHQVQSILLLP